MTALFGPFLPPTSADTRASQLEHDMPDAGRDSLENALSLYEMLGAIPDAERTRDILGAAVPRDEAQLVPSAR